MISVTARLGASRVFADIDRLISPAEPDLAKLVAIGAQHGVSIAV
jgi:hypothetical protein